METGPRLGILGGSFNPVHLAHLRAAVEVRDRLGLDRVELVPAAVPPHKPGVRILPFTLRVELLRAATRDVEGLAVNLLEGDRPGPSYTYYTLREYLKNYSPDEFCFIMGIGDFLNLETWHRGLEIPGLADVCVVSREGRGIAEAREFICSRFSEFAQHGGKGRWRGPGGRRIYFVDVTRLDISSSKIRELWRRNLKITFLTPISVERLLHENRETVDRAWGADSI